jgi:hypothetical protein
MSSHLHPLDFVLEHLTNNKVSVKIVPNQYHENTVCSQVGGQSKFCDFTDLMIKYKSLKPPKQYKQCDLAIDDLLYCFYVEYEDATLTLLAPRSIAEFLEKYSATLVDSLDNHEQLYKNLKLKTKTKETCDVLKDALNAQPAKRDKKQISLILTFLASKYGRNVYYDGNLYEAYPKVSCTMKIDASTTPYTVTRVTSDVANLKQASQCTLKEKYRAENVVQNLKSYCVKDLKDIAKSLSLPLTKEEDGKTKALLKADLRSVIEKCLAST